MKALLNLFLVSLFIVSCNSRSPMDPTTPAPINPYTGEWKSVERFYPYSSTLTMNDDRTFQFQYGACMDFGFSTGIWETTDKGIVLNSQNIDRCMYTRMFGVNCQSFILGDSSQWTEYLSSTTLENCEPKSETNYVIFDAEEFCLEGNTLKHILKLDSLCPSIKEQFIKIKEDATTNTAPTQALWRKGLATRGGA
jgi:hypothetical protein